MKERKIPHFVIYFASFFYMELLFRVFASKDFSFPHLFLTFFYLGFLSFVFSVFSSFGKKKWNQIFLFAFLFLLTVWYSAEIIFKNSFHVYFSLATTFFADQAISFAGKILEILLSSSLVLILLFLPFLFTLLFRKKIDFEKKEWRELVSYFLLGLVSYFIFSGFLIDSKSEYSLYHSMNNNSLNKEAFGALPSVFVEIRNMIFPRKTLLITTELPDSKKEDVPIVYDKNTLDISFGTFLENETNSELRMMHEYFLTDPGTSKNEYTGMFEGKNLILIMAESFNSIAVDEELTPTLYRLSQEGFVFENFYSPVILSTIGGEFQELTGLYPNLSMLSNVWRAGTNYFPFGYGNLFSKNGYQTFAYHNHKFQFQNRDKYLASLGLSNYKGCGNGLEERINCKNWPESDLEMLDATLDDFLEEDKFFTYYVTVSGHMSYNFRKNDMAIKNQELVNHLPYSEDIKAYLASQIELDKALEHLLLKLEASGKLKDTVIALVGDHYPYDISLDHINEIANPKRDEKIEINRSNFILWNSEMDTKIISKVGGNMDVLPTLLNLFALPYDSRLIMGRDLLSDSAGLVIFDDSSWVSDFGVYNASKKSFTSKDETKDWTQYVDKMNQVVSNRVNLSKLLIEKDYYKKVLGD